jgi:thiol-disulfide isomerase/thioredoxin
VATTFALQGEAGRAIALTARDGTKTTLADVAAPVTVLVIWSTGCAPCVASLPDIDKLASQYKKSDVAILAVSVDAADQLSDVNALVDKLQLRLPIFLGDYKQLSRIGMPPLDEHAKLKMAIPRIEVIDARLKMYVITGSGQDDTLPALIAQAREGKLPDTPKQKALSKDAKAAIRAALKRDHPKMTRAQLDEFVKAMEEQ